MRLFEWQSKSFEEYKKITPDFVNYLSGVWQNRNRYLEKSEEYSEEEEQEQKIQKQRFFDFTFDGKISARNYVGVVQYEGLRIEVYPKLFKDGLQDDLQKRQINFLYWLTYCKKIKFPFSFADVTKLKFDDYLELLIYVFANYTEQVISNQPFQSYQEVEEQTTFLKGRLSFDNYTKHNLITGQWQNFYCNHEPFVYDNLFNQIIKYVAIRLSNISQNFLNKEKLNEILFLLHDVSDVRCTVDDCEKVKLNPLFEDHKYILELCKLYLSNQVIDMESDDSKNFCFLIPMEYIFEDFIAGFIADKWPSLKIKSQSTNYLARVNDSKVFQIKNDIYIENELIIDTKYKFRYSDDDIKSGVNQSDLYQMISYAIARNCNQVLLLYPYINSSINTPTHFNIPSLLTTEIIYIDVHSIDITFEDINEADTIIQNRIEQLNTIFKRN